MRLRGPRLLPARLRGRPGVHLRAGRGRDAPRESVPRQAHAPRSTRWTPQSTARLLEPPRPTDLSPLHPGHPVMSLPRTLFVGRGDRAVAGTAARCRPPRSAPTGSASRGEPPDPGFVTGDRAPRPLELERPRRLRRRRRSSSRAARPGCARSASCRRRGVACSSRSTTTPRRAQDGDHELAEHVRPQGVARHASSRMRVGRRRDLLDRLARRRYRSFNPTHLRLPQRHRPRALRADRARSASTSRSAGPAAPATPTAMRAVAAAAVADVHARAPRHALHVRRRSRSRELLARGVRARALPRAPVRRRSRPTRRR